MLKKRPSGKDVNDEDVFVFNGTFEDPRAKVHINSIQVKETVRAAMPPLYSAIVNGSSSSSSVRSPRNRNARRVRSRATGSITSTRR